MQRGSTWLVCLLTAVLSCGGAGGAGKGATGGGMAGQGGQGGAGAAGGTGGVVGTAGAGGAPGSGGHGVGGAGNGTGGARDAGQTDARGGGPGSGGQGGAAAACTVVADGGTIACTTALAAANEYDIFCGLKAGAVRCWSSSTASYFLNTVGPAAAAAPPGLVQLAIIDSVVNTPLFCGVDGSGAGSCWGPASPTGLGGPKLRAVSLSRYGACALYQDGSVTCPNVITPPPSGDTYAQIVVSEDVVAALDTAGTPYLEGITFPLGVYTEIAANNGRRVGAIRSDGAAVSIWSGANTLVKTGTFRHIAVDDSSRACALDAAGEIACWSLDGSSDLPFSELPGGPFVQVVGSMSTFCALRTTGTTACWGDTPVDPPAGW